MLRHQTGMCFSLSGKMVQGDCVFAWSHRIAAALHRSNFVAASDFATAALFQR